MTIKQLLADASNAPWWMEQKGFEGGHVFSAEPINSYICTTSGNAKANAVLIVAMRNSYDAMLAEHEALDRMVNYDLDKDSTKIAATIKEAHKAAARALADLEPDGEK